MLRKLFYTLSPSLRFIARYLYYLPSDIVASIFRDKAIITPPRRLIYTGSGDFIEIGNLFLKDFIEKKIITSASSILDVGCGLGRTAIPLTRYLVQGKYEGFDIIKLGIDWCKKHISTRFSNFHFKLVDLYNDLYRKKGESAACFRFPYDDDSFDLVIVLSVFTHMLPDEVDHYLSEINRALKTNGFCYATFFILNKDSTSTMMLNNNEFNFQYNMGSYSLIDREVRSANVAFQEEYLVNSLIAKNNFKIISFEPGSWSTGKSSSPISFQERVVIQKI